jgi:hypothetical protein
LDEVEEKERQEEAASGVISKGKLIFYILYQIISFISALHFKYQDLIRYIYNCKAMFKLDLNNGPRAISLLSSNPSSNLQSPNNFQNLIKVEDGVK